MSDDETFSQDTPPATVDKKWYSFYRHPLFVIICAVIGILSAAFTVYSHFANQRSRELTYSFNPVRTEIVNFGETSSLTVSYDGKPVKNSVTAIQCMIWNAGKEPIRTEDILKSITINAPQNVKILEAKIRHVSRPEIQFVLNSEKMTSGEIGLTWKILEQNDGASIQIVFEGARDAPFIFEGTTVGLRPINQHKIGGSTAKSGYEERVTSNRIVIFTLLCVMIILASLIMSTLLISLYKRRKLLKSLVPSDLSQQRQLERMRRSAQFERGEIISTLIVVILTCVTAYMFCTTWWNGLPFDF